MRETIGKKMPSHNKYYTLSSLALAAIGGYTTPYLKEGLTYLVISILFLLTWVLLRKAERIFKKE